MSSVPEKDQIKETKETTDHQRQNRENSWTRKMSSEFNDRIKKLFSSDDIALIINPDEMELPIHKEGVMKEAVKLKNNKRCENIVYRQLLKYKLEQACKQIENMLNYMKSIGEYCPIEIKLGILTLLAKLAKKDVNINVRPIVLLSVIRKILTIILIDNI